MVALVHGTDLSGLHVPRFALVAVIALVASIAKTFAALLVAVAMHAGLAP